MIFAVVLVLSFILQGWFARKDPAYHWSEFTISELGQIDGPLRWPVALYYFLPVGLLLLAGMASWWQSPNMATMPLLLMSSVPLAYLVAAAFPCDKGAPLLGSARNRIHMFFGALEYLGASIGLFWLSYNAAIDLAVTLKITSLVIAFGLVLLSVSGLRPFRGIVQRLMEASLFISFLLIDSNL